MVYTGYKDGPYSNYTPNKDKNRKNIIYDATEEAQRVVDADYPYAVYRTQEEVTQLAERIYQQWLAVLQDHLPDPGYFISRGQPYSAKDAAKYLQEWNGLLSETKRLYTSAFVGKYLEEVAKKDTNAKPKTTPPQPPFQQTANPTGAKVTVIREEHTADIHMYWLQIADPRYLDEAYEVPVPLTVDFSEAPATDFSSVSSSGMSAIASAGDVVKAPSTQQNQPKYKYTLSRTAERTTQSQSKTPQKKPRIYWGKS